MRNYTVRSTRMFEIKDNGHHIIIVLPPMEKMPKAFTLKTGKTNEQGYWEEIKGLEIVVPLETLKMGSPLVLGTIGGMLFKWHERETIKSRKRS